MITFAKDKSRQPDQYQEEKLFLKINIAKLLPKNNNLSK
jgi:hypothetical protein